MSQPGDDDLRAHFHTLREYDAAHAPEFRAVRADATRRADRVFRQRTMTFVWLAAAACLVIAAGLVLRRSRHDATVRFAGNGAPTISNWSSPTDGLLRAPGRELLSPPPILSSILDGATGALVNSKGD